MRSNKLLVISASSAQSPGITYSVKSNARYVVYRLAVFSLARSLGWNIVCGSQHALRDQQVRKATSSSKTVTLSHACLAVDNQASSSYISFSIMLFPYYTLLHVVIVWLIALNVLLYVQVQRLEDTIAAHVKSTHYSRPHQRGQ